MDDNFELKKLNLGCGLDKREGYLNIDIHKFHAPDVVADVLNLGFLKKGTFTEIIANDILEHLPRESTKRALLHWAQLLSMNGILRLRVPSLLAIANELNQPRNQSLEKQELLLQNLFGTQAYDGDFHFTSFTEVIVCDYLSQTGFALTRLELYDGWMFDVVAKKIVDVNPRDIGEFFDLLDLECGDEEFVNQCYVEILKRTADNEGLSFYVNQLAEGALSRQQLTFTLSKSHERLSSR